MPYVHLNDVDLYYETHGEGPPLVFLSGTACDGELWKLNQVPEFSRDHRVVIFDYRGTGRSGKPSIKFTTKMFAEDVALLLDHLEIRQAIVCGHSMGGRVAQLLALDYPDKVGKLILASTGDAMPETQGIPLKLCLGLVEKGYERFIREYACTIGFTEEFADSHPDRVERFLKVRIANLPPIEFHLRHVIARQEHDTSHRLGEIGISTLILVGEDDHLGSTSMSHRTSADNLVYGIRNAKLHILPKERHHYFFVNPDAAHRIIREFLDNRGSV